MNNFRHQGIFMNNFNLIQEHFTQLHCPSCDLCFTKESIDLIREEKDYWVVRVCCSHCNHSPGFAIVGIEYETTQIHNKYPLIRSKNSENLIKDKKVNFDEIRFRDKPKITGNDVIDAHNFIKDLGNDWMKYLKKDFS